MNSILNRAANLVLLEMSMLSLCVLVRDSFSLVLPAETFLWLALLCLLLWVAMTFNRGFFIGMPLSAAVLWYVYTSRSADLMAEVRGLLENISAVYYGHYTGTTAVATAEGMTGTHEVAVLFFFFVLAAFIAASLSSGSFRVSLSVLATLPLFALCIAVNGVPDTLPVLVFLLFLAGLQLGGDVFRLDDGAGKALFFGIVPCLLVLSVLLLFYNPKNYEPTEHDISLSQRFDKLGNAMAEWLSEDGDLQEAITSTLKVTAEPRIRRAPSGWDQGGDDLDLKADFDTSKLDDEAFRVTSDTEGSLYFRGRSYGDYNGSSWSAAVEDTHGRALRFAGEALASRSDTTTSQFQLKSVSAYDVLYLPYYSIPDADSDVLIPATGYSSYGGSYYLSATGADALAGAVSLPGQRQEDERRYREYAHSYYTRLPDSTRSALAPICSTLGWDASQSGILWSVAEYVRSQGIYDVNVAPYPSDDYAVWFLTQSHTGYCIHFATAAVALYRTLGIPARVCEGYLVNNTQPGNAIRVTGSDAHAWVEVYVDGLGWVPVEVTASAAEGDYQPAEGSVAPTPDPGEAEQQMQATPTPQPEAGKDADSGDTERPEPDAGEDGTPSDETGGSGSAPRAASPILRAVLTTLLVLAGLSVLVFGRYFILRKLLQSRLSDPDGNRRAVNLYRQAERVLRYGGEMPKPMLETAEKARFSQHEVSGEELQQCSELLAQLTAAVSKNLKPWKRILFRFWSGNL